MNIVIRHQKIFLRYFPCKIMHFDQLVLMSLTFVVQVPRKKSVRFADIHYPSDAEEEPDTGSENSGRFDFVILDTKHM